MLGDTFDDPKFRPFFQAAEDLGAVLFFHQGAGNIIETRTAKYKLTNAIGNLTERTLAYATLVFGGVMDEFPNLRPLLAHAGGYTAFGIPRMDKVAGALEGGYPESGLTPPFAIDDITITKAPSEYLREFYYDCCTYDEMSLRFLIDRVGVDKVVLGTDYPAPMFLPDAVNWINSLESLTENEKDAILVSNATTWLGL